MSTDSPKKRAANGKSADDAPVEGALERLEAIVEQLEKGGESLEKSIDLYEEGKRLGARCLERLAVLERRVQLVREAADGQLVREEFDPEHEGD